MKMKQGTWDWTLRTMRNTGYEVERRLDPDPAIQKVLDQQQTVDWLLEMGPWDVIGHFTWKDRIVKYRDGTPKALGMNEHSAARGFERYMTKFPGVSYFYAVEKNPSRDGHHVHALWGDCHNVWRKGAWQMWHQTNGRARIEPVRSDKDVAAYVTKHAIDYVVKHPGWWNIKLQWHRKQRCLITKQDAESGGDGP